jgi:NAD(P)-dependent dehydrogenase (short-subunit alcohol dehydrogenase family)
MSGMVEGKVIVVTGAGGGIGREFALALAKEGAKVVVNDLGVSITGEGSDASPAQKVVAEIKAAGGEAVSSPESVSNWMSAQKIIQCALDTFGRIDGVINNAGILRDRMFHKMSPEEWDAVIGVHLNGSFYVARAAATHFREQQSGAYVHVSSNSGIIGAIGQANYSAAKMGIVGLSRSIALEMSRFNVRSNILAPAAWSRMIGSIPTDTEADRIRVERMKNKMAANKIAPLGVYLLSDEAKAVNGQIFYVRANEVMVMSQPRVIRSVHREEGWTPRSIADHAIPAMRPHFTPLESAPEVHNWEPV